MAQSINLTVTAEVKASATEVSDNSARQAYLTDNLSLVALDNYDRRTLTLTAGAWEFELFPDTTLEADVLVLTTDEDVTLQLLSTDATPAWSTGLVIDALYCQTLDGVKEIRLTTTEPETIVELLYAKRTDA